MEPSGGELSGQDWSFTILSAPDMDGTAARGEHEFRRHQDTISHGVVVMSRQTRLRIRTAAIKPPVSAGPARTAQVDSGGQPVINEGKIRTWSSNGKAPSCMPRPLLFGVSVRSSRLQRP